MSLPRSTMNLRKQLRRHMHILSRPLLVDRRNRYFILDNKVSRIMNRRRSYGACASDVDKLFRSGYYEVLNQLPLCKIDVHKHSTRSLQSFAGPQRAELLNIILMVVVFGNFPNPPSGYSTCFCTSSFAINLQFIFH